MCLTIRLVPDSEMSGRLRELSQEDHALALGWRFAGRSMLGRHAARLSLHACDLLADDADWDATTWSMSQVAAGRLAESMEALLEGVGGPAAVEALWEGEAAASEEPIGGRQFIDLIRRGVLGTHTRYLVSATDYASGRQVGSAHYG